MIEKQNYHKTTKEHFLIYRVLKAKPLFTDLKKVV